MKLGILYFDEIKGFYKSKLMIVLWIGLPLLSFLMKALNPNLEGFPISSFVAILISSIGGTLSSVMLSTSITSERNQNVYDLFLIRPVKRWELLVSKYLAVITCLFIALLISITIGIITDIVESNNTINQLIDSNLESIIVAISGISISCAIGILFGILVNSVAVSAILSVYLGNQITSIILLPAILIQGLDTIPYSLTIGLIGTIVLLSISIIIFSKKSQY